MHDSLPRRIQGLAEEFRAASRSSREVLVGIVRTEVEKAVSTLGLVRTYDTAQMADAITRLESRVADLEQQLAAAEKEPRRPAGGTRTSAASRRTGSAAKQAPKQTPKQTQPRPRRSGT
ncbi:MAG: hypothetical protein ACRDPK_03490 [Carbonactinosporaceae bacterium]